MRPENENRRARRERASEALGDEEAQAKSRDPIAARNLAMARLTVREYSVAEMKSYLKKKGYLPEVAAEAVSGLEKQGLISDQRYSRVVARHQGMRDKGPMQIVMRLKQKGVNVSRGEAEALYRDTVAEDEVSAARAVLEKRYPRALSGDPDARRKAFQAMLRRGFSSSVIARSLSMKIDEEGSSGEDF